MSINLNPQKGFRDLYPEDKARQNMVFSALQKVAAQYGYEQYDGPILESIDLYLNKTSAELIERQTFQVKDKKDQTLILRPEMTPSLARMIAKRANELVYPAKFFNLGLRFRYEAPQKGREREFYQADFDILGSEDAIADAEVIATAVGIFQALGATKDDFVVYVNSREFVENQLNTNGVEGLESKQVLALIDRRDKISEEEFSTEFQKLGLGSEVEELVKKFLNEPPQIEDDPYFSTLFKYLKAFGVDEYCQINPAVVRGLDYYTGVVFEVKEKGGMTRSLLGGGRYDNLVGTYNPNVTIPGVGFATSDVVLLAFCEDKGLLKPAPSKQATVLVAVFDAQSATDSIEIVRALREQSISAECYADTTKKLERQLKYADKNNIPYVILQGDREKAAGSFVLKNMKTGTQEELKMSELQNLASRI